MKLKTEYLRACSKLVDNSTLQKSVLVESDGNGRISYIGTNGHTILVCHEDRDILEIEVKINIPLEIIKPLKKSGPKFIDIIYDDENGMITQNGINIYCNKRDFITWWRYYPSEVDNITISPINPKYITTFNKVSVELKDRQYILHNSVPQEIGKNTWPHRDYIGSTIVYFNPNVIGIIMGFAAHFRNVEDVNRALKKFKRT